MKWNHWLHYVYYVHGSSPLERYSDRPRAPMPNRKGDVHDWHRWTHSFATNNVIFTFNFYLHSTELFRYSIGSCCFVSNYGWTKLILVLHKSVVWASSYCSQRFLSEYLKTLIFIFYLSYILFVFCWIWHTDNIGPEITMINI